METVAAANEEAVEAWSGVLFDRWARYRDVLAVSIREFSDVAFDLCRPQPGERVLDVGCGLGETTRSLAELVGPTGEVVGIDAGERFVETATAEAAEAGAGNVSYMTGDVQVADMGSGFDLAFSRFGTMFFANPVAALRNVRSSLRPVSFSTMEARTMASSGVFRGRSFLRSAHARSVNFLDSASMRSMTAWRGVPRSTMKVSGSSVPSSGTTVISPVRLASALSRSSTRMCSIDV